MHGTPALPAVTSAAARSRSPHYQATVCARPRTASSPGSSADTKAHRFARRRTKRPLGRKRSAGHGAETAQQRAGVAREVTGEQQRTRRVPGDHVTAPIRRRARSDRGIDDLDILLWSPDSSRHDLEPATDEKLACPENCGRARLRLPSGCREPRETDASRGFAFWGSSNW